jgi:hypothetical protein
LINFQPECDTAQFGRNLTSVFEERANSIFTLYESSLKMATEFLFETLCVSHSSSILKMNTARYIEMLVPIYQTSRRHVPEGHNIDSYRPENLESQDAFIFFQQLQRREIDTEDPRRTVNPDIHEQKM